MIVRTVPYCSVASGRIGFCTVPGTVLVAKSGAVGREGTVPCGTARSLAYSYCTRSLAYSYEYRHQQGGVLTAVLYGRAGDETKYRQAEYVQVR